MYGANTKWCTTQERYWDDYKSKYKLIYIINKKSDTKYAVSSSVTEDKVQGWLANDKESNPMLWSIPNDVMNVLVEEVRKRESVIELAKNHGIAATIQQSKKQNTSSLRHYEDVFDDDAYIQDVRRIAGEYEILERHQELDDTIPLSTIDVNRITDIMRRLDSGTTGTSLWDSIDNAQLPF
jgi:hypothetical protein